ncbi:MAG: hypothetical protein ABSG62_22210 [Terracidiphilus sp.]
MYEAEAHSRQISPHSILFVSFEAARSLRISSAAAMVEPKIGSTGWIGFFSESAGTLTGDGDAGFGAMPAIFRLANLGRTNRVPSIFFLHLCGQRVGGSPHSILSKSPSSYAFRLRNMFPAASKIKNIAAPQSSGVNSNLQKLFPS